MIKLLFITVFFLSACHRFEHTGVVKKVQASKEQIPTEAKKQINPYLYEGIKSEKTIWPKKNDFHVEKRYDDMKMNKCLDCHKDHSASKGITKHPDIKMNHATEDLMSCTTCHNTKDPWKLKTLKGNEVSINHAYMVCTQCHFQQANDWSNGAHGKRIGGWSGDRIVRSCTGCHNPHSPQFSKKIPAIQPQFSKWKK